MLKQGLISAAIVKTEHVVEVITSPHGAKYIIDGYLFAPLNQFGSLRKIKIFCILLHLIRIDSYIKELA